MKKLLQCGVCGGKRKVVNEINEHGIYEYELSCGHRNTDLLKSEEILIVGEPLVMSEELLRQGDYFSSILYASAMLEGYGKQLLEKEFKKRKLEIGKQTINNLSLHIIIIMLYAMRLITTKESHTLLTMKKYRNEFVHKGKVIALSTKFIVKVEPVMKEIHRILRKIRKKLRAYSV